MVFFGVADGKLFGEGSRLEQYKESVANFGLKDRVEFTVIVKL
jgi:hypothetical protein